MFFQQFLLDRIEPDDEVTRSFVEQMLVPLMDAYAVKSAKGGDHARHERLDEMTKRKFEANNDQSMVSHLLNGIFPTMRLLAILKAENLLHRPFSDVELRLYLLSYLMHDVDKIVDSQGIETANRAAIEEAKAIVERELQGCNSEAFFPDFASYLEDIVYLVVNTQRQYGTHLSTYGWQLHMPERRLLLLRDLCTYSDVIAFLVPSPSAVLLSGNANTLTSILTDLSSGTLVFTYHQLRETRGLLTNVINNALVDLFDEGHDGIWPYLFFADGVVYIKRKSLAFNLTSENIVDAVRAQLREKCANSIKLQAPGFKFSIQGIAKHPGYYFEFLTLEEYAELLARFTIERTRTDITTIPMTKMRQMQVNGGIAADLPLDLPTDDRTGMVARFLSVVFTTLLDKLDKKQPVLRQQVEEEVVRQLGLGPYWTRAQTIPGKGGVEYRWFWLAACYLREHPGTDRYEGEGNLFDTFKRILQLVIERAGDVLRGQMPQKYLNHLTRYLDSMVELPRAIRAGGLLPDFTDELERYSSAKSKRRQLICTLCNSAYPTEEQEDSAMLFQPWVYKNKLSLYAGKNAGGVCVICSLELMLRQILQRGQLRLTGSKFEALKTKYIAVYPNFFFTAETGALVEGVLVQLQNINFFTVRKDLDERKLSVEAVMGIEAFARGEEVIQPLGSIHDREENEDDEEDLEKEVGGSSDRGYIKFQPDTYPGMFLFGMKAGKDDNDTASWAMPAFLALAFSLVTNTKVVVSELSLPLFHSGHDFRETVIFDAPHPYLDRLLRGKRVRVNQLLDKLRVMTAVYRVNIDTYARKGKPEWGHLSDIVSDLETDPLFLFSYLRKQQRRDGRDSLWLHEVKRYLDVYQKILEEDLSKIQQCVDRYTVFYKGEYKSHSILKPIDIVAKAIINSPLNIEDDDLLWQIQGELKNWLDRVRDHHAAGWAIFYKKEDINTKEPPLIREFVTYFFETVFKEYCEGERGLLRNRINRFKDGCEAYYVYWRNAQHIQEPETEVEEEPATI